MFNRYRNALARFWQAAANAYAAQEMKGFMNE